MAYLLPKDSTGIAYTPDCFASTPRLSTQSESRFLSDFNDPYPTIPQIRLSNKLDQATPGLNEFVSTPSRQCQSSSDPYQSKSRTSSSHHCEGPSCDCSLPIDFKFSDTSRLRQFNEYSFNGVRKSLNLVPGPYRNETKCAPVVRNAGKMRCRCPATNLKRGDCKCPPNYDSAKPCTEKLCKCVNQPYLYPCLPKKGNQYSSYSHQAGHKSCRLGCSLSKDACSCAGLNSLGYHGKSAPSGNAYDSYQQSFPAVNAQYGSIPPIRFHPPTPCPPCGCPDEHCWADHLAPSKRPRIDTPVQAQRYGIPKQQCYCQDIHFDSPCPETSSGSCPCKQQCYGRETDHDIYSSETPLSPCSCKQRSVCSCCDCNTHVPTGYSQFDKEESSKHACFSPYNRRNAHIASERENVYETSERSTASVCKPQHRKYTPMTEDYTEHSHTSACVPSRELSMNTSPSYPRPSMSQSWFAVDQESDHHRLYNEVNMGRSSENLDSEHSIYCRKHRHSAKSPCYSQHTCESLAHDIDNLENQDGLKLRKPFTSSTSMQHHHSQGSCRKATKGCCDNQDHRCKASTRYRGEGSGNSTSGRGYPKSHSYSHSCGGQCDKSPSHSCQGMSSNNASLSQSNVLHNCDFTLF